MNAYLALDEFNRDTLAARHAYHADSALFDATDLSSHRRARELCGTCPVIEACRANLLETRRRQSSPGHGPEGTWAGVLLKSRGEL